MLHLIKRKKYLLLLFLALFVLFAGIIFLKKKRASLSRFTIIKDELLLRENEKVLGVYDKEKTVVFDTLQNFTHLVLILNDDNSFHIDGALLKKVPRSQNILLTIELWGDKYLSNIQNNPLEGLVKGKFDHVLKQLFNELIATCPSVYVRFNPDMEVPVNRYPWQKHGGVAYIAAFRYFAGLCESCAPQVKQVWGPVGYPGAEDYYPGDDVVDAASITIKSDSEMPLNVYPKNYSVEYDLFRRLHRMRFIDKPVFVLGSPQIIADSVDNQLVSSLTEKINRERDIVYSVDNFKRKEKKVNDNQSGKFEIGLYDPQSLLNKEESVTVEHLFVDFGSIIDGTFQTNFNQVVERSHNVIVTFEPFRNPNGEIDLHVLQNVTKGMYDNEINRLYEIIQSTDRRVYLRYAHEMEIPITRYPWQSQDPIIYIKSYRYFMTFKNPQSLNIKRVWGPAGDRGSLEWWPGNDVVDFISIAIYGLPDKNITDPEKQESFSTIFYRKYWRLRFVDKPIFITEFGVKGPEEYQTKWLEAAAKTLNENPQVIGINYFNMSDTPGAWGKIKAPDWSITATSLRRFMDVLKRDNP